MAVIVIRLFAFRHSTHPEQDAEAEGEQHASNQHPLIDHHVGIRRGVPWSSIVIHFVGLPAIGALVSVPVAAPAAFVNDADAWSRLPSARGPTTNVCRRASVFTVKPRSNRSSNSRPAGPYTNHP